MADITDVYAESVNTLKTTDIAKGTIPEFSIKSVEVREFGEDKKLVLELNNDKSFVLNKTNARQLASNYSEPDYTKWVGKKFKVIRTNTQFQGGNVECLRVV